MNLLLNWNILKKIKFLTFFESGKYKRNRIRKVENKTEETK
jgi:hypothetical protein